MNKSKCNKLPVDRSCPPLSHLNKKSTQVSLPDNSIWTEKYRPNTLSQLEHQKHVVNSIRPYLQDERDHTRAMPSLILSGPPGIGKTSLILAFCKDLYGKHFREMTMFVNASCDRKEQVLRVIISNFATMTVYSDTGRKPLDFPFKTVILDEVDSLPATIQTMLKLFIEEYKNCLRFYLICNDDRRLCGVLKSKCSEFKLLGLTEELLYKNLTRICVAEQYLTNKNDRPNKNGERVLDAIVTVSNYDMRKAIKLLSASYQMYNNDTPINDVVENIYKIGGKCVEKVCTNLSTLIVSISKREIARSEIIDKLELIVNKHFVYLNDMLEQILEIVRELAGWSREGLKKTVEAKNSKSGQSVHLSYESQFLQEQRNYVSEGLAQVQGCQGSITSKQFCAIVGDLAKIQTYDSIHMSQMIIIKMIANTLILNL